jgi:DNA-binding transcriptional ArsR family regulator
MESDAAAELDPRLAHALAHPTRSAILRLLVGAQELAPASLAEKLDLGAASVRYHVGVLTACGAVEAVGGGDRRGELLIRLVPLPGEQRRPAAPKVSDGLREDVSEAQLRNLIEIAGDLRIGYGGGGA